MGWCLAPGVAPAAFSLDHIGPMAWTAEDCAIMLQALAGHDPRRPGQRHAADPDYRAALTGDLKGVRVGVIRHFHEVDYIVEPAVQTGIDNALAVFRSLGATVSDVTVVAAAGLARLRFVDHHHRTRRRL